MNDPIDLFGITTSSLELISFVLAVITVVLNIRRVHWAWLFSIVSSATYGVVFYQSLLYGGAALQVVFIVVSVWGWHQWLHGGDKHDLLPVTRSSKQVLLWAGAAWAVGFVLIAGFLDHYTDTDVPYPEGFLTAGSLVGQLLLARKKVENWIVWIIVDVLYVGLFVFKGLNLTAVLYAVFVVLASIGLSTWYRHSSDKP
ncbi:nicotinamide riboside transporter PnuC [Massilia sp. PAMC28688]|uniref:nicotinamide riboside transporter PnuC n=1 Tax=Massilia sp. PAMC28688 TaxID=2861283 RepID=UPI001C6267E3|nr:nicotinamide riboside transporter PnuC [Massilia sp. PAMC28688]QYF92443.1 nicotinamide riboside transporter PnuC [Massilia sp. PAMC28688]